MSINARSQLLLKLLVEKYIGDGLPVSSKVLAGQLSLGLSPATIRNVMADLEEQGYLCAPHTSAGRVPTNKGYRFFVDTLLETRAANSDVNIAHKEIKAESNTQHAVARASHLLSDLTQLAGIVTTPKREQLIIKQIEFLPLSENRVLVILVYNDNEVENRVIYTQRQYTRSELEQAANYLTSICRDQDLSVVKGAIVKQLNQEQTQLDTMVKLALDVAEQALVDKKKAEYVVAGKTNLLDMLNETNSQKLRTLLEAIDKKQDILHLLEQSLRADGVRIFIGEESGHNVLEQCSVVTAPYKVEGQVMGVLGVIGPIRMAYSRVIPIVDMTARLLGSALNMRD